MADHQSSTSVTSLYPFRPPPATAADLVWASITLLVIWGVISLYLMWKLKASKGDEYVSRVVSFLHAAASVILCVWCLTQRYDEHLIAIGVRSSQTAMTSAENSRSKLGEQASSNNNHQFYSSSSVVSGFVLCHANQAHKDLFGTEISAAAGKVEVKSIVRSDGDNTKVDKFLSAAGGCPEGLILGDGNQQQLEMNTADIQHENVVSVYQDAPTHYLSSSSFLSAAALRKQAYFRQLAVDSTSPFSRIYSYFTIFGCFPSTSLPSEQLTLLVSATYFTVDLVGIYAGSYYDRLFVLHHVVSMATCYGTAFLGARAPIDAVWALANTMSSLVGFKTGMGGIHNQDQLIMPCGAASCQQKLAKDGKNKAVLAVDATSATHIPSPNTGTSADSLFKEWSKLRNEKSKASDGKLPSSASDSSSFWGYPALASGMELVLVVLLLEGANPLMHLRWILIMDYNKKRRGQLKNNSSSNISSSRVSSSMQSKPNFEDADVSCGDTNNIVTSCSSGKDTADGGRRSSYRSGSGNVYIRTVPFENTCPLCCPSPESVTSPTTNGTDQQYLQLVGLASRVIDNPSTYTIERQSASTPATPLDGSQHQSTMDGEVVYRQQPIGNNSNGSMAMMNRDRQNATALNATRPQQPNKHSNNSIKTHTVSVRQFSNAVVGGGDTNDMVRQTHHVATPPLSPAAALPYRIQMSPATFMLSSPRRSQHNNGDDEDMPQMQLPPHAIGRSLVDSMNITRGNSNSTSYSQLPQNTGEGGAGSGGGGGGHARQVSTTDTLLAGLTVPPASAFKEVTFLRSEDEDETIAGGGTSFQPQQQQQPRTTTTSPTLARRSQSPTGTNNNADNMIAVTFFPEPVTLNTTFDGKANSLVVSPLTRIGSKKNPASSQAETDQQPPAPQLVTFCTCCTSYFLYQGAQSNNTTTNSNPSDTSGNFSRGGVVKRQQHHGDAVDVVHLKRIYPRQTLIMDLGNSQPSTAVASPVTSQPPATTDNNNLASRTHSFSSHTADADTNAQDEHTRTCNFIKAHSNHNNDNPHQTSSSSPFGAPPLSHRRAIGTEGMVLPTIANTLNPIKKLLPASWGEKLTELGEKIAQHQRKAASMFDSHVMLFSSVPTNRYFSDDSIAAAGFDPLWVVEHAADVVLEAMEEVEAALYIPPAIPHVVLALRRPPVRENRLFAFIDAIFVPIFVALRLVFGTHILFKFGRCPTTITAILLLGIGFYILSAQFIVDVIRKNKRRELWL